MKRISTLFIAALLLLCTNTLYGQSCCKKPTGMQALAMNKSFKAAHLPPKPFNYTPQSGSMVQFPVTGGADGNAFYVPPAEPSDKVLLVFHEWWGLNDYIKKEAENWQKLLGGNVHVYAVDLYDGKVAVTQDEAGRLAGGLDQKRGQAIVNGLLQKIGRGKKIATIGWCMGGSWSFTAAVAAGTDAAGCVMYYGFPERDASHIKPLKCDVLYIRGSKDDFIKESDVIAFENKVKVTGHNITMFSYEAPHAFANPSNPKFDASSAADAQKQSLKFLKEKLGL